jgi:two-component system response regulator ResD
VAKIVMDEQQTILVVDDETTVRNIVRQYLEKSGYRVIEADNGGQALQLLYQENPDLLILDIMLPGLDGFTVARSLRDPVDARHAAVHANIPIIMLTARTEEKDRIAGFELGTDDYVVKPFSPRELVMRVKALLRRTAPPSTSPDVPDEAALDFPGLHLDLSSHTVTRDGHPVTLTLKEFELLYYLARNPRRVFTRTQLLDYVWGYDFYGDDSNVTVHIHRLREKLETDPANPHYIHTVWGVGYKFEVI